MISSDTPNVFTAECALLSAIPAGDSVLPFFHIGIIIKLACFTLVAVLDKAGIRYFPTKVSFLITPSIVTSGPAMSLELSVNAASVVVFRATVVCFAGISSPFVFLLYPAKSEARTVPKNPISSSTTE